ncbi:uncharacterized protein LOC106014032, partial [Aplysia californica]|uniref:Uncharacterized protein LOC106014032 n=1 Tax=Aplysia californica TaxID=6500 RepID=A0ABM1AF59_APLCA
MKDSAICILLVTTLFALPQCSHSASHAPGESHDDHEEHEGRIDVFHEILEKEMVEGPHVLSVDKLQDFITDLFSHLEVHHEEEEEEEEEEHGCHSVVCIRADQLIEAVGGNISVGLAESEFPNASLVLLYYVSTLEQVAHTQVNMTNMTLTLAREHLLNLTLGGDAHAHIESHGVTHLLDTFKDHISHEHHDHGEEHEGHGHDDHDDDDDDDH